MFLFCVFYMAVQVCLLSFCCAFQLVALDVQSFKEEEANPVMLQKRIRELSEQLFRNVRLHANPPPPKKNNNKKRFILSGKTVLHCTDTLHKGWEINFPQSVLY